MTITLRLSWRNLWRSPRRTALTLSAIAFATGILVFFVSLQLSSYSSSIQTTVRVFSGYAQVQKKGYLDKPRVRDFVPDAAEIQGKIRAVPGVQKVVLRGEGFGIVSSDSRSYGVQIVGVEPQSEGEVSSLPGLVKWGRYLNPTDQYVVVIGKRLAENLKVSLGGELSILGQGGDGSLAAGVFSVVGIFESGVEDFDRNLIETPLTTFRDSFALPEGAAHSVVITVAEVGELAMVMGPMREILRAYPSAVALSWEDLLPGIKQSIELDFAAGWLFYLSLIVIVGFCVANTFLMSVLERVREYGMMMSLGCTPARIGRLIFVESALLTLIGMVVGIGGGALVVTYYHLNGFTIPGAESILKQWNLPSSIYPSLSFTSVTLGPLIISIISALAVLYPIFRVTRISPLDAMRSV